MKFHFVLTLAAALFMSSCATIVSQSRYPVAVSSVPPGARVTITNRSGNEVFNGVAPTVVTLKSGSRYFNREIYKITFSKEGFENKVLTLEADVDGWYFGNLIFAGAIGFLIVDPLTGAMYRISEKEVQGVMLPAGQGFNPTDTHELRIMSLNEVPASLRDKMIPMQ